MRGLQKILCLSLVVMVTSCGVFKKNKRKVGKSPTPQRTVKRAPTVSTNVDVNASKLYPMPADPGYFKKFNITSTQEYIDTFSEIAQYEMEAFGIPASITLAQGILESGSGQGQLTQKTNNHFGIKCHNTWSGEYELHDDDAKGECFRKYNHPMFSFRDHSNFLATRSRYRHLFNLPVDNYRKWAYGLKAAGYATDKKYPQKLIGIIEKYRLNKYDDEIIERGGPKVREPKSYEIYTYIVEKGDTLYAISKKHNISVKEIMFLNKMSDTNISVGQQINLRKERTR